MTPWLQDADVTLYHGDVLAVLRELTAESVDCCVTSPPYWGLRDYGQEGQLGLEPTPEEYVTRMVEVFREVRRVLAPHGTVWLNLGDSYAANRSYQVSDNKHKAHDFAESNAQAVPPGLKPKDLVGIPWRVAFALQADGWYLRSDIIWAKPNPMPESVTDRPTKAHEYVFLLTKQPRYFFDQEAVREAAQWERWGDQTNGKHEGQGTAAGWIGSASKEELQRRATKTKKPDGWDTGPGGHGTVHREGREKGAENYVEARGRNIRSVWEIATQPYPEAHFATFPEELARRCIAAGTSERGRCPECGAPWVREVEREFVPQHDVANSPALTRRNMDASSGLEGTPRGSLNTQTVGWRASCECGGRNGGGDIPHSVRPSGLPLGLGTDLVPAVVLDPFMGSGTVAHVARKLGRHAVGIDLNESYLELAARRLQQQSLFAEPAA